MAHSDLNSACELLEKAGEKPIIIAQSKNSGTALWNQEVKEVLGTSDSLVIVFHGAIIDGYDKLKELDESGDLLKINENVKEDKEDFVFGLFDDD